MLRASRKLVFAIEALLDIAYNAGGDPVRSSGLTERHGIPRRYLEPVLQQLVRDGILESLRGPRGGYRLARERSRISLGDIVRAVRTLETAEDVVEDPSGSDLGLRVVRPLFAELQDELMARLDGITLDDLCTRARLAGISSEAKERIDFVI